MREGQGIERVVSRVMEPPRRIEDLVDLPIPDLELPSTPGGTFRFRGFVGVSPLVLFFYLRDGTPG